MLPRSNWCGFRFSVEPPNRIGPYCTGTCPARGEEQACLLDRAGWHRTLLSRETPGRLIQSLKSFLTSRTLQTTEVFGRRVTIEDLIARILRDLREKAEQQFGIPITSAVAGRPVRFVGAETEEDNQLCGKSPPEALISSPGSKTIEFEMEPVAAAHYYESTLQHDELILIGDFGGGTSDFSLITSAQPFGAGAGLAAICWATPVSPSRATRSTRRS